MVVLILSIVSYNWTPHRSLACAKLWPWGSRKLEWRASK